MADETIGGLYPKKYRVVPSRCGTAELIPQPVKGSKVLRVPGLVLRQPAHHLTPSHFTHGTFLDTLAVFPFPKATGNKLNGLGQTGFHCLAILFGGQVQHKVCLRGQLPSQVVTSELI